MQKDIIFDCGKLRSALCTEDDFDLPPTAPTSNHDFFVKKFRSVAKHPNRVTVNVPELPRHNEISPALLPNCGGHEPESELTRRRRRPPNNKKGRGRTFIKEDTMRLRGFFAVSMTREEKKILLLYKRQDVYLVAVRDSLKRWWEFSNTGGTLFTEAKGLGFAESYVHMNPGNEIAIGLFQFEEAFYIFSDPSLYTVDQRKRASQVMIALSSESARMTSLAEKFGATLSDESGQLKEILGGNIKLLIQNWEKISHHVIDNSKPSNLKNEMNNVLNENNVALIEALKEAGMERIEDAPAVYGLLLAKALD
ncbi:unnamed protein product [Amaranthus hypochondriacus]